VSWPRLTHEQLLASGFHECASDCPPSFDPSKNLMLQSLRSAWPERDDRDRPDYVVEAVGDDGSVRIRPLVWADLIEWVERNVEGDVA